MTASPAATKHAPLSFDNVAERLRDGPVRQLIDLYLSAWDLSRPDYGDLERLRELQRFVLQAHKTLWHFNAFTRELETFIRGLPDATAASK